MRHPLRQRQFGRALRCQRPPLLAVLAWLAVLAMLLGTAAHWSAVFDDAASPHAQTQGPHEPGDCPDEQEPTKLRRQASAKSLLSPPAVPAPAVLPTHLTLALPLPQDTLLSIPGFPDLDQSMAWRSAPGHRQQRGQAPPLA